MHTHIHTPNTHTHTKHLFFFLLHTYSSGLDPRVPEILSSVWKNLRKKIVEELRVRNVRNSRSRSLRVQLLSLERKPERRESLSGETSNVQGP